MNATRLAWKARLRHGPLVVADAIHNWRHVRGDRRVLIVRHSAKSAHAHRDFLRWLRREAPEAWGQFEFRRFPCRIRDWSRYALHACWAGDTFQHWDPRSFDHARRLLAECRARGIPVINPVDQLANAGKFRAAELMARTGVLVPRMARIEDASRFRRDLGGLSLPLLVREDHGHGQPTLLIRSLRELSKGGLSQFRAPIAVEFVDTRSPRDGLYRKYRYLAVGDGGLPRHLIVNDHWEVRPQRRVFSDALRAEELACLAAPDPHAAILQQARRALGLDVLGFDYSLNREGRMIVWEANPFADLNYPRNPRSRHIFPAVERSFALLASFYLARAGIAWPKPLDRFLTTELVRWPTPALT